MGFGVINASLTGEDWTQSIRKVSGLVRGNGTVGLSDNLIIKTLLNLIALVLSLFSSLIAYVVTTHIITIPSPQLLLFNLLPPPIVVAILAGILPWWIMGFCSEVLTDASDTFFLCVNVDLERRTEHCVKAMEAFAEPDGDGEWV